MAEIKQCKCGKYIDAEKDRLYQAHDLQKDYEEKVFCSAECLKSWIKGKELGMWVTAGIGALLALIVLFQGRGIYMALVALVVPYTLRQIGGMLAGLFSGGAFGEFLSIFVFIIATGTIVYPAYKFVQELVQYKHLKSDYSL